MTNNKEQSNSSLREVLEYTLKCQTYIAIALACVIIIQIICITLISVKLFNDKPFSKLTTESQTSLCIESTSTTQD